MVEMTDKERALLKELQDGFKLERQPFKRIARELGYTEEEVIATIRRFQESGIIRRIGVAIRPERIGQQANALVVWEVPPAQVEEIGINLAARSEISHCYDRECPPGWTGNLFTMIHARDEEHLARVLAELSGIAGRPPYRIFRTMRELKKTSMRYFTDQGDHE
jgi:siroheme decarboxylase